MATTTNTTPEVPTQIADSIEEQLNEMSEGLVAVYAAIGTVINAQARIEELIGIQAEGDYYEAQDDRPLTPAGS